MPEHTQTSDALLVPILLGSFASVFLAGISFVFAGGGHGTYLPMVVFFPYSMLLALLHESIDVPHIALGLIQFPVYGALLGIARSRQKPWRIWLALAALHVSTLAITVFLSMRARNSFL